MSSIDIKINIKDLMDYSASLRSTVEDKTLIMMIKSFSEYIMEFYGRLIESEIYSNRYKGKWEPVSDEGYREYLGTTPSGDIISLIRDALEVKKLGYHFVVRINPRYKYPGSNLNLVKVLRAIDSGTSKFSARPIFNHIIRDIKSHVYDLFRGYLKIKGVI